MAGYHGQGRSGDLDRAMTRYEGLVRSTAAMLVPFVEIEFDDVCQLLRIKVFRALKAYDPAKARGLVEQRYVFMCLRDQAKDIAKRKKLNLLSIEDVAPARTSSYNGDSAGTAGPRDTFDAKYLATSHDEIYGEVDEGLPLIPNTLTVFERQVLALLYWQYKRAEIAERLDVGMRDVERAVKSLRLKMHDWKPATDVARTPVAA